MKIILALTGILLSNFLIAQVPQSFDTTRATTIGDLSDEILNWPPTLNIQFYTNGKKVYKKSCVTQISNSGKQKTSCLRKFSLDTINIPPDQNIKFSIEFENYVLETMEVLAKRFFHGGNVIAGKIKNYNAEKKKFDDDPEYDVNNTDNKLFTLLSVVKKGEADKHKNILLYTFIQSDMDGMFSLKYRFE